MALPGCLLLLQAALVRLHVAQPLSWRCSCPAKCTPKQVTKYLVAARSGTACTRQGVVCHSKASSEKCYTAGLAWWRRLAWQALKLALQRQLQLQQRPPWPSPACFCAAELPPDRQSSGAALPHSQPSYTCGSSSTLAAFVRCVRLFSVGTAAAEGASSTWHTARQHVWPQQQPVHLLLTHSPL